MQINSSRTTAKQIVAVFLVASVAMLTYHGSTSNELVWDSYHYLVKNVGYISKLSMDNIIWMFLTLEPYWHPLTWLSWAIDYQIYGGLVPSGYHLSNNVLHAINSALVFMLTLVVFGLNFQGSKGYPFRSDNRALIAAFSASLFFAVHPQHVESVAWVAERKDLLCQFFLMLSMLTYVKYATCDGITKSYWFNGSLGLFCLALLSKPMAVTFPAVLLLIDIYPLRRTKFIPPMMGSIRSQPLSVLLREKLPFFLLSIFLVLVTLLAHVNKVSSIPLDLRLLNACNSILLYITKFLVPLNFAPLYPYLVEPSEAVTWKAFLPIIGVLGLTIASVIAWKRNRHEWLVAWVFYLLTVSPVLGLIQSGEQGAADRFAYLPTLPVYFIIGAGILAVLDKATPVKNFFVLASALFAVLLLADKTQDQIQVWKNSHTLWMNAVKYNPNNVTAHYNLGITYFRQSDYEKAAFHFDKSATLPANPTSAVMAFPTLAYRGLSYVYLGRYSDALKDYMSLVEALESSPHLNLDRDCIYFNTGWLYAQRGLKEKANEVFGLVGHNSDLRADSVTWLEFTKLESGSALTTENLPRFCTTVFPSSKSINSESQHRITDRGF